MSPQVGWPLHEPVCSSPPAPRSSSSPSKLNSVASETVLRSPRSPPGSKIFLSKAGSVPGGQYLFAGVKLPIRSLGHLEGGPDPEQQPQEPEPAPLRSSPASGRGMEAAPSISHSVVLSWRRPRLRCCSCCSRWQKAEKKGREVPRGRMQGAGLTSATSRPPRQSRPSFLLPPSSSPPTHVALSTAFSFLPRARAGGVGTTRCSAAHLPVAMAAVAAGARRAEVRASGTRGRVKNAAGASPSHRHQIHASHCPCYEHL